MRLNLCADGLSIGIYVDTDGLIYPRRYTTGMQSEELRAEMGDEFFELLEAKQNEMEWMDR